MKSRQGRPGVLQIATCSLPNEFITSQMCNNEAYQTERVSEVMTIKYLFLTTLEM